MPQDFDADNTFRSDLFALGSALYELEYGSAPFVEMDDEVTTRRFTDGELPDVGGLRLRSLILGC